MIIEKTDKIKPNTAAYIKNGRWTHYFLKDSATGNLLGVIPSPTNVSISVIPTETTYNDLHENDSISIFKDSIELSYLPDKLSYLPDNLSHMPQIKITKESLLNYQNDFISQLNKWVELLNKNNNKSEIIFNNSNFGKDWTPYDFKQKIQPCGGAYFNIHSFKDGYDLVRHYNQLIETAADSMTLFNLDEISYFVITDEIGDYHY